MISFVCCGPKAIGKAFEKKHFPSTAEEVGYFVFGGDMSGASELEILLGDLAVPYIDSTLLLMKP